MLIVESINYFIDLLEIDPMWIKVLLLALIIKCAYPRELIGEVETEEKNGKMISKIFHFR